MLGSGESTPVSKIDRSEQKQTEICITSVFILVTSTREFSSSALSDVQLRVQHFAFIT